MNHLRAQLIFFVCLVFPFLLSAQFHYGGGISYIEFKNSIGIQAKTSFPVHKQLNVSLSAAYFLNKDFGDEVNVDVHYRWFDVNEMVYFYPLAGLSIVKEKSSSTIRPGFNLGLSSHFKITDRLDLYIEPKVIFARLSTFAMSTGVYF